ncbi:hypothetical protein WJT86_09615 [Microvirga sp. W0021]|uniref:Cell division protein FtsL n=1 Tax=Hohaiivirga grylli TaxID=3133970 RepID=A0ABV0BL33_9HYPH
MTRFLHIIAILALISSAIYAYSIKYDTLYYSEQVAKLKNKIEKEKGSIAVLKAEWQLLNNPERLQSAALQNLDLQIMDIEQLGRWSEIPNRPDRGDEIGKKLQALGLGGIISASGNSVSDVNVTGAIAPAPSTPAPMR